MTGAEKKLVRHHAARVVSMTTDVERKLAMRVERVLVEALSADDPKRGAMLEAIGELYKSLHSIVSEGELLIGAADEKG